MDFVQAFRVSESILVVDDSEQIFTEYKNPPFSYDDPTYTLLELLLSSNRVCLVHVQFHGGIAKLPPHLDQIITDDDDKKFVAVADIHPATPPIVNATDRDWAKWETRLRAYGIEVIQLC